MEDAWARRADQAQFLYRCDDFLPSRWLDCRDLDRDFLLRSRDLDRLLRRLLLLETYDLDRLRSLERVRDLSLPPPRDLERDPLRFAVTRDDLLRDRLFLRLSLERERDFLLRERDRDGHFLRSSRDTDLERRQLRERDLARFRSRDRVRRFLDLWSLEEREDRER